VSNLETVVNQTVADLNTNTSPNRFVVGNGTADGKEIGVTDTLSTVGMIFADGLKAGSVTVKFTVNGQGKRGRPFTAQSAVGLAVKLAERLKRESGDSAFDKLVAEGVNAAYQVAQLSKSASKAAKALKNKPVVEPAVLENCEFGVAEDAVTLDKELSVGDCPTNTA
jgi:hypothetical protein